MKSSFKNYLLELINFVHVQWVLRPGGVSLKEFPCSTPSGFFLDAFQKPSMLPTNISGGEVGQGGAIGWLLSRSFCETTTSQAQWLGTGWEDAISGVHCEKANCRVIKLILRGLKIKESRGEASLMWVCSWGKRKGEKERVTLVTVNQTSPSDVQTVYLCTDILWKWQIITDSLLLRMCLSPDAVILFYSDVSVKSWLQSGLWEHKDGTIFLRNACEIVTFHFTQPADIMQSSLDDTSSLSSGARTCFCNRQALG